MKLLRETKWLKFFVVDRKPKTFVVDVINVSDENLGVILWHPPWRQYVFQPSTEAIFNDRCLQDIKDVLATLNADHKEKKQRTSGRYTFHQKNAKPVDLDIVFNSEGAITSAVDASGNDWKKWLRDYGALDPFREDTRLEVTLCNSTEK